MAGLPFGYDITVALSSLPALSLVKTGHLKNQNRPLRPETGQDLAEGPVTLTFPASMSPESYQDLSDYLTRFLRKAKRSSDVAHLADQTAGREKKAQ